MAQFNTETELGLRLAILRQIDDASSDKFHHYHGRTDGGKKDFRARSGAIAEKDLKRHMNGVDGPTHKHWRGLGKDIMRGDGTTHFTVLDFDNHDGTTPDEDMLRIVRAVSDRMRMLTETGIPHKVFRSSGGKGFQIWIMWAKAVPAKKAKALGWAILGNLWSTMPDELPLKIGTGGLFNGTQHEVEAFPKGKAESYNVMLPLFGKSEDIGEPGPFKPFDAELTDETITKMSRGYFNDQKKKPKAKTTAKPKSKAPDTDVPAAMDCFLSGRDPDVPYDEWKSTFMIMMAAFEGTEHEGLALAKSIEWSQQAAGYSDDEKTLADYWEGTDAGSFDELAFWRIAKKHGYEGGSPIWDEHAEKLEALNEAWAVVQIGSKVAFMELATHTPLSVQNFDLRMATQAAVAGRWVKWAGRREYVGLTIEPEDYDGPMFNVFRGLAVDPVPGGAPLFEDYVLNVVCGGDLELARWVTMYVADMVQNPTLPGPGVALSLKGKQGTGKSTLGYIMRNLIGPRHSYMVADAKRMMGQFNEALFGAVLVQMEETVLSGSAQLASQLKAFITDGEWRYERKHVSDFSGKNVSRIIATTNDAQATHIDSDDRRWTVIAIWQKVWTQADWDRFHTWLEKEDGFGKVMAYLLEYPVDRKVLRQPHATEAKGEDKLMSDPLTQFLVTISEDGMIPGDYEGKGQITIERLKVEVDKVHGRREWNSDARAYSRICREKLSSEVVWQQDKVRSYDYEKQTHRSENGHSYLTFEPVDKGGRKRGLRFGSPRALADNLMSVLGLPMDGEFADEWAPDTGPQIGDSSVHDERGPF